MIEKEKVSEKKMVFKEKEGDSIALKERLILKGFENLNKFLEVSSIHKQQENESNLRELLKKIDMKAEVIEIDFSNQAIYNEYNETTINEFWYINMDIDLI